MKDKETETLPEWIVKAATEILNEQHEHWIKGAFMPDRFAAEIIAKHRPATLEDRALDALEVCHELICDYHRPDGKPDEDVESVKAKARAILREAGRVK